ncbi:MAG: hypothetical protein H6739_00970 [Alphaproteobacteria bacterium]|nr:hypothetical protein [Alphaproteobacteria bacterium]
MPANPSPLPSNDLRGDIASLRADIDALDRLAEPLDAALRDARAALDALNARLGDPTATRAALRQACVAVGGVSATVDAMHRLQATARRTALELSA